MKLVESFLVNNPCYKANVNKSDYRYTNFQKNGASGLMLHSVGCSQPKASVFINAWNDASYTRACVHGFIDGNDGTVYQTLPWNFRGWHGGGSSNNTHIGVEMCEPSCIKYNSSGTSFTVLDSAAAQESVKKTYEAAVELFAMLCQKYNLNPLTAICSHSEGYKKGIATNHGDPEHLWKGVGLSYTMDTFRAAVKAKMNSTTATSNATTSGTTTSAFKEYKIKVSVSENNTLNIRTEPNTNSEIVGELKKDHVVTIREEKDGWGRVYCYSDTNGAAVKGWISLKYTKKI